ncbi:MAG TPA: PAS domain-containing protein, partial [Mucilaginibacter sp.]
MIAQLPETGYRDIFYNSEATMLIIGVDKPYYTIVDVNDAYLNATNSTREALVGASVFVVFPANPNDEESKSIEQTIFSFDEAISTKRPHTLTDYRYDIPIKGNCKFEKRWWTTTNTPVLDEKGEVSYLIHSPIDVTELHTITEREQKIAEALRVQRQQLFTTFMQAPVGIAILKGNNYVIDMINPSLCQLYGQTPEEMIGKPIFDCIPFVKGKGFEGLLNSVLTTGVAVKGDGVSALLVRNGSLETVYVNFVYEPYREPNGEISGVIVIATEVTEMFNARKLLEEAEERARLAVDAVGLGTYDMDLITGEIITSN